MKVILTTYRNDKKEKEVECANLSLAMKLGKKHFANPYVKPSERIKKGVYFKLKAVNPNAIISGNGAGTKKYYQ